MVLKLSKAFSTDSEHWAALVWQVRARSGPRTQLH